MLHLVQGIRSGRSICQVDRCRLEKTAGSLGILAHCEGGTGIPQFFLTLWSPLSSRTSVPSQKFA